MPAILGPTLPGKDGKQGANSSGFQWLDTAALEDEASSNSKIENFPSDGYPTLSTQVAPKRSSDRRSRPERMFEGDRRGSSDHDTGARHEAQHTRDLLHRLHYPAFCTSSEIYGVTHRLSHVHPRC